MAKIVKRRIWWNAVDAVDLAGYRIYIDQGADSFSYSLPFIQVAHNVTEVVAPDAFPAGTFAAEIDYNVWITALDLGGNESDPLALSGYFDFIPPPAPSAGGIETL